jgi:serine/threonine protein phosphatase PrpC
MGVVRHSTTPFSVEPISTARTSVGMVRRTNEDRYIERCDVGLWAVADGMGGHQCGEAAASLTVEALARLPKFNSGYGLLTAVRDALDQTNQDLVAQAAAIGDGAVMGATVVALMAFEEHFACVWAGDSRAYRIQGGQVEQITRDHSVVQDLIDRRGLSEAEAGAHPGAHMITRALGASRDLELDLVYGPLQPGDLFLLCSDGLTRVLSDDDLATLAGSSDLQATADQMMAEALARGARDNVTFVLVQP